MGNEVRNASVDEKAGVIDVGGDAAGGRAAASVVADTSGKGIASREEGGLKADGEPKVSPCLQPVAMWATNSP